MATSDVTIAGAREMDAALQTLSTKIEKNIMRSALRAGANVVKKKAQAMAPVDTGALRKSLKVSTKSKRGNVTASLKASSLIAPHAHLVEFGTKPHHIAPKDGGALVVGGHILGGVDHPGAKPHPFLRPAFDGSGQEAINAVGAQIRKRLTKEGINVPAPEPVNED